MNVVAVKNGSKKFYLFERLNGLINEIKSLWPNISYFAVVPKYLRKKLDKVDDYCKLIEKENSKFCEFIPKINIKNDNYFIEIAKKTKGYIIKNDNLRDFLGLDVKERVLPFMFILDKDTIQVVFHWKNNILFDNFD